MRPPRLNLQCPHYSPLNVQQSPYTLPLRPLTAHPPPTNLLPRTTTRPASHASQGRANKAAPGPGKRLGLKRAASELVVPNTIIFRQRGTLWFPGENCGMGRDHTIYAKEKGYVVYYTDPADKFTRLKGSQNGRKAKRRKYIGVVFERGMKLPLQRNLPRVRRLGLEVRGREMSTSAAAAGAEGGGEKEKVEVGGLVGVQGTIRQQSMEAQAKASEMEGLRLRPGYQYRESNWSIGRAGDRAMATKRVRKPKRNEYLAWRKLNPAKARNRERKNLIQESRKKGKDKK